MEPVVLIPTYRPDQRLTVLVKALRASHTAGILVVNDGSGTDYEDVFRTLEQDYGCEVLTHTSNLGKGAALKTGIRHLYQTSPELPGCVTADADLQHSPRDILRVAGTLREFPDCLVLGARSFTGDVPLKSRWGNRITAAVFRWCTGVDCPDTQTGLRGIPSQCFPALLDVPGSRFEYEMNMLLEAVRMKTHLKLIPIQTIYDTDQHTTHFRTLADSVRICAGILRYAASSLACALVDLVLFRILAGWFFSGVTGGIMAATVIARCCSGVCNFLLNRRWVFASDGRSSMEAARYGALFVLQMLASGLLVTLLGSLSLPLLLIKIFVDGGLFVVSYQIQKRYVFAPGAESVRRK